MKGYWLILTSEIKDPAAQHEYRRLWGLIAERYQARVNPGRIPPLLKEAKCASRVVIVEFPSYEAAKACYEEPAYLEALPFALRASTRDLLIFGGEIS